MIWKIDDMETQPSSTWKKGSLLIFYIYDVRHLSSVDQSKKEALMTQAKLQSDYSCVPFYSGHRAVGIGRQGGDHQIGRSVNPIPTRGSIMSTVLLVGPPHDFQTFLLPCREKKTSAHFLHDHFPPITSIFAYTLWFIGVFHCEDIFLMYSKR